MAAISARRASEVKGLFDVIVCRSLWGGRDQGVGLC
jgi:hypothetical protein